MTTTQEDQGNDVQIIIGRPIRVDCRTWIVPVQTHSMIEFYDNCHILKS